MIPLPSIRLKYAEDELQEMAKNNRTARRALTFGVDKKFLLFTEPDYLSDIHEQYELHNFSPISITCVGGETEEITPKMQVQKALELINDGALWSPSLIIINSPNYFCHGANASLESAEGFLSHLLCSLAHRVVINKAPGVDVNFLETMQLDHAKDYQIKLRHVCVWGPMTENVGQYDLHKTTQFLFSFRQHTRILLLSARDLGALLEKFKVSLSAVDFVFNLATDLPKKGELRCTKVKKKSKAKSTIGV